MRDEGARQYGTGTVQVLVLYVRRLVLEYGVILPVALASTHTLRVQQETYDTIVQLVYASSV